MNYVKSGLCWTRFQSWNNSRKLFDHLQFSGILSVKSGGSLKLEVLDRGFHEIQDGGDVSAIQAEVPAGKTKFNVSCQIKFGHFTFQTWLSVSITSFHAPVPGEPGDDGGGGWARPQPAPVALAQLGQPQRAAVSCRNMIFSEGIHNYYANT